MIAWQESWASPAITGFRFDLGCEDAYWRLSLDVEDSLVEMSGLCGISLDFKKAFDRVPWEHVFAIGRAAGLPSHILTPLQSMYGNLQRHFRIGGMMNQGVKSTNGILQGCPLSVVLLNLLMQVWRTNSIRSTRGHAMVLCG